jgi:hypothetical protein
MTLGSGIISTLTVLATVFAIPNHQMINFAIKKATKLKNAAQSTA